MAQVSRSETTSQDTLGRTISTPRRPSYQGRSPAPSPGGQPSITNTDESIVLSDLVRSGEASRLRRRGALRMDRNSMISGHAHHPRHYSFDSDDDDMGGYWLSHQGGPSHLQLMNDPEQDNLEDEYILLCGAPIDPSAVDEELNRSEPFQPSILPITPTRTSKQPTYSLPTNGCGAVVHLGASPSIRPRRGHGDTFIAQGKATDTVVPLGIEYFDSWPELRFESSACGCVREGVGCACCGNPLGTRWKLCKAMTESQRKVAWRYGRSSSQPTCSPSSQEDSNEEFELYSFFASAVTIQRESRNPSVSSTPSPSTTAKPSLDWPAGDVTYIAEHPQPPDFDWLGSLAGHYDRSSTPQATSASGLAINVQVTVASSVSYTENSRSLPDLSSTVEAPRRPGLVASQSAPAAMYGYHLTESPDTIAHALPDEDLDSGNVPGRSASPISLAASAHPNGTRRRRHSRMPSSMANAGMSEQVVAQSPSRGQNGSSFSEDSVVADEDSSHWDGISPALFFF